MLHLGQPPSQTGALMRRMLGDLDLWPADGDFTTKSVFIGSGSPRNGELCLSNHGLKIGWLWVWICQNVPQSTIQRPRWTSWADRRPSGGTYGDQFLHKHQVHGKDPGSSGVQASAGARHADPPYRCQPHLCSSCT